MSVEANNVAGANSSSYSLSDKLHHVYLGNRKTFGGEVLVRAGNLVSAVPIPVAGGISGFLSVFSNIGGLAKLRSNPQKAQEFFRDAETETASFTRTVSDTYQALLRVFNPGALCEDQRVEAEVGGVDRRYDSTGFVSTNTKIFFDKQIAVLSEANRGVVARALVVVRTILVAAARVVDLIIGAIAAIVSVLLLGTSNRANDIAYNSLKIGALLGDVYDLCKNLYDPSSLGKTVDEAAYLADTNQLYLNGAAYDENNVGFSNSRPPTPIEQIAPSETVCGESIEMITLQNG